MIDISIILNIKNGKLECDDEVTKLLVLCSNGLSSEMFLTHIRSKIVGCKTSALVVTADNE